MLFCSGLYRAHPVCTGDLCTTKAVWMPGLLPRAQKVCLPLYVNSLHMFA
jgi:hypothetical protein